MAGWALLFLTTGGNPSFWRLIVWIFAVTGVVVALTELGLLFREALLVGAPAFTATLLVDTFLYNGFLIRIGDGFWVLFSAFLFFQSCLLAVAIHFLHRYWYRRER
ncbi:hypothetical protein BRC83_10670 [Halobacteriales archaeon QS_1_68_17]|nr:MAG: hypothetical protein BRC83_10670 [Halobacteriales archaeon QS_1_68_17]